MSEYPLCFDCEAIEKESASLREKLTIAVGALKRIADYKKQRDTETDYESTLSIMAIAEDAVRPTELIASGVHPPEGKA
jgi:hypothetical protein